jgi:hypothetical protein
MDGKKRRGQRDKGAKWKEWRWGGGEEGWRGVKRGEEGWRGVKRVGWRGDAGEEDTTSSRTPIPFIRQLDYLVGWCFHDFGLWWGAVCVGPCCVLWSFLTSALCSLCSCGQIYPDKHCIAFSTSSPFLFHVIFWNQHDEVRFYVPPSSFYLLFTPPFCLLYFLHFWDIDFLRFRLPRSSSLPSSARNFFVQTKFIHSIDSYNLFVICTFVCMK